MVTEFRPEEREERAAALADLLNAIVSQALVPSPLGGRTALREWLVFEPAMKAELLERPVERWAGLIGEYLSESGQTMAVQADRAFARGEIGVSDHRRIVGSRGGFQG